MLTKKIPIKRLFLLIIIDLALFILIIGILYSLWKNKYPYNLIDNIPVLSNIDKIMLKIDPYIHCPPIGQTFETHPLGGRCLRNCKEGEKFSVPKTAFFITDQSYNHCHCVSGWKEISPEEGALFTYICK